MNSRNLSTDYDSLILLPVITDESDFVASFPNIYRWCADSGWFSKGVFYYDTCTIHLYFSNNLHYNIEAWVNSLGISWVSHIIDRFPRLIILWSSNLTSVIKQFIHIPYFFISTTLLYHYMKNLLPNIYLLNNKQGLNTHRNET